MILEVLQKFLIAMAIFIPLEHLLPIHNHKIFRKGWKTDVSYALGVTFLTGFGIVVTIVFAVMAIRPLIPVVFREWVAELPLVLQVLAIMVIADIGYYWIHRMHHEIPYLWNFHAVHHSIENMDWLAAHRVHPLDQILTRGVSLILPYSMGFTTTSLAVWAFIFMWHSLLKHSNVKVPLGPFRWLFASPVYHHWHHANIRRAFDKNYAGQLPILDIIFGTAIMDREPPDKYGTDSPVSDNVARQLIDPIVNYQPESTSAEESAAGSDQ